MLFFFKSDYCIRNLTSYDIKDEAWRLFILNKFDSFDCADELSIFIRGCGIRWSDKYNAKRLISILIRYKKFILCYTFVRAIVESDEEKHSCSEDFKDIFFYFLQKAIEEKQVMNNKTVI